MLVAGNWKMHTDLAGAVRLASEAARATEAHAGDGVAVALCPPFVSLEAVAEILRGSALRLGAQDMHWEDEGAFTGAVSAPMLASVGCHYVILGHSERRQHFGETDVAVGRKVRSALRHGLVPILCVGETLEQREGGQERAVVERQIRTALDGVDLDDPEGLVVAYEPVWAIGTGRTATPEQAQAMHAHVRALLADTLGPEGQEATVLYGGSVKPGNAAELFAQPDIDGGLIGGASLDAADFGAIVEAAARAA
jgi:triosephosphate isomerase (TIM)